MLDHPEAHQQGGGLTGAVRAEQRDALAFLDGEVDVVDGPAAAVLLHQPPGLENMAH